MVRLFTSFASTVTFALLMPSTSMATKVTFKNQCQEQVQLYDNAKIEPIPVGQSTQRDLPNGWQGMFRHGQPDQATLAEFSITGGKAWYDVSVIPPGPGNCKSFDDCKAFTKKRGFNVAMDIIPKNNANGKNCRKLECRHEQCPDGYLFPHDIKTHDCPDNTEFEVVFCAGEGQQGNGNTGTNAPVQTPALTPVSQTQAALASPTQTPPKPSASDITPQKKNNPCVVKDDSVGNDLGDDAFGEYDQDGISDSDGGPAFATSAPSGSNIHVNGTAFSSNGLIKSSFTYRGKFAGNVAGSYEMVTDLKQCSKKTVEVNSPVGPMSEEVTMVFRGPMDLYNIAVFDGSSGGDWKRVSSYAKDGDSDNIVFLNNKNIDFNGGFRSPQGFSSEDGTTFVKSPTKFKGKLAEATNPEKIGTGPGVQTGVEVHIMTEKKCQNGDCKGFHDENGYRGWNGGKKMFVTKVQMPQGAKPNQPAIWMLNAQVVRSNQYACNCRGMGGKGGCGELDIAEVIETNPARDRVTTHYYFYDGSIPSGADNFAARPTDAPTIYITLIDDSGEGTIKIFEIDPKDFDFNAQEVSASQIKTWLDAKDINLLK